MHSSDRRMRRPGTSCRLLALIGTLVLLCSLVVHASDVSDLVAQADTAYDRWDGPFDFDAYETDLMLALGLYGQALPLVPETDIQTRAHVLFRLAFGYHDYTVYFDKRTEFGWRAREQVLEISYDYALERLRLDPAFHTEEKQDLLAALRISNDADALFIYGNAYGEWLNYHPLEALDGGVHCVLAAFERTLELDETYFKGGAHFALAALISQAFFLIPYDFHDAEPHYQRALEMNPDNIEALNSYAMDYAARSWNVPLELELLDQAEERAESPDFAGYDPLYDHVAILELYEILERHSR